MKTRAAKNWYEMDVVREHVEKAAQYAADQAWTGFHQNMRYCLDERNGQEERFESPLEAMFAIWWHVYTIHVQTILGEEFYLHPQMEVEIDGVRFRLDFAIELTDVELLQRLHDSKHTGPRIAVELDGHAFHERTPEQVQWRDRRDRLLQQAGWTVFHYSWSAFVANPTAAVWEVFKFAKDQYFACLSSTPRRVVMDDGTYQVNQA